MNIEKTALSSLPLTDRVIIDISGYDKFDTLSVNELSVTTLRYDRFPVLSVTDLTVDTLSVNGSIAMGTCKKNNDAHSYVWSGEALDGSNTNLYTSHGEGTFNLNPKGTTVEDKFKNLYIGDNNFIECVLSAISLMTSEQRAVLTSILTYS